VSLVGFRAQNHPQQKVNDDVDDRSVTPEVFAALHARFRFTIDAAASPSNALLARYWTRDDDALGKSWAGERVWCNPPYSDIRPWVQKAWLEWTATGWQAELLPPPSLIVMLLPANRTEQGWWQDLVEPGLREQRSDFRVEFLPGRMRFIRPNAVIGPKGDRPPFGCCLIVWGAPGVETEQ
jgi:phage N-6-adenine-methyltransferase